MYYPIPWARTSLSGRQSENDGSRLVNFYPAQATMPGEAKTNILLHGVPGTRRWMNLPAIQTFPRSGQNIVGGAGIHGLVGIDSPVYGQWLAGVFDQYWFFVTQLTAGYDPTFANTALLTIPVTDTQTFTREAAERAVGPVRIVTDSRRIVVVSGTKLAAYDLGREDDQGNPNAGFLSVVRTPTPDDQSTLADQEFVDAVWIDGYFILAVRSGRLYHSLYNSLDFREIEFATAETEPDEIVGVASYSRRLYVFGSRTVEQWYNAGADPFAFLPDRGFTCHIGCGARDSIAVNEHGLYWLTSDGSIYYMAGTQFVRISSDSVDEDIGRSTWSQAQGYTYAEEGHWFYTLVLSFADGTRKNWTYDVFTKLWHERSDTDILTLIRLKEKMLIGRRGERFISRASLQLGGQESTAGVQAVRHLSASPPVFENYQRAVFNSFQIDVPFRPGGQAADRLMVDWSDDNGERWRPDPGRERALAANRRYKFNELGSSRARNIRVTLTTTRRVDILGAYVEAELLGD